MKRLILLLLLCTLPIFAGKGDDGGGDTGYASLSMGDNTAIQFVAEKDEGGTSSGQESQDTEFG